MNESEHHDLDIRKNYPWIENLFEGAYLVDVNRRILYWNKGAQMITGYSSEDILHRSCFDNILNHVNEDGVGLCFDGCPMKATIEDGQIREASVFLQHKEGHRLPVRVRTIPIRNNADIIIGAIEFFTENKEDASLRDHLENYQKQSFEDPLTKAANRRYLSAIIESKIREFKTIKTTFGIAFLDIDDFKQVNDTYGHETGDQVIKNMAETIQNSFRKHDSLGRWGGEEFIIVFSEVNTHGLMIAAEKMRKLIAASHLRLEEEDLKFTVSIGATIINESDTVESIITRADQLMYSSKKNGKNIVTFG
jgi:diguanylate cyclase (GGDEF)-like protein/PAS domain S-box-containing protein